MKSVLTLLVLSLIAGCAQTSMQLYSGPEKAQEEVAIIRAWSPSIGNISVLKIDGKDVQNGLVSHVYVLPGKHTLTVRFVNGAVYSSPMDINVETHAGHTYIVQGTPDFRGKTIKYWLEDKGVNYDKNCLIAKPFEKSGVSGKGC